MKKVILIMLITMLFNSSSLLFAQNAVSKKDLLASNIPIHNKASLVVLNNDYRAYEQPQYKSKMKKVGGILFFSGLGLTALGAVLMQGEDEYSYSSNTVNGETQEKGSLKGALGLMSLVTGIGATTTGGILYLIGRKKEKEHRNLSLAVNTNGIGLSFKLK